jgi:hypothetical protein
MKDTKKSCANIFSLAVQIITSDDKIFQSLGTSGCYESLDPNERSIGPKEKGFKGASPTKFITSTGPWTQT